MKKLFSFLVLIVFVMACNNSGETNKPVGDTMTKDPTTGQPITTEPDTVGPDKRDSINQNNQ